MKKWEDNAPKIVEGRRGGHPGKLIRMTEGVSAIKDIVAAKPRGNHGANKGKRYVRGPINNDVGRKFGKVALAIFKAVGIPEYSCVFSNHVYSVHQKLAIYAFMARENLSFNSLMDELGKYRGFVESIDLKSIPHGSTICKFMKGMESITLQALFMPFSILIGPDSIVATDATDFSNFQRSAHYERRCDDFGRKLPHRTFTKLSISADTSTRLILSARSSAAAAADVTFMDDHISDLVGCHDKIAFMVADKGYDATHVLRNITKKLCCEARIPVRTSKKKGFTVHGLERRRMLELCNDVSAWKTIYGRRSIIESDNFMMKNQTGASIRETSPENRQSRCLAKALAFNIGQSIRLGKEWMLS